MEPFINVSLYVPDGLFLVIGVAFLVYVVKSIF
jgi:hypothetical protein